MECDNGFWSGDDCWDDDDDDELLMGAPFEMVNCFTDKLIEP